MRAVSKILRRFLASTRPSSASKTSKVELNFKESNGTPGPYDVIDHNVPGMELRLRLYEMRRLKEQIVLDKRELESFKYMNYSEGRGISPDDSAFELSYTVTTGFPGISCPTQSSSDSNVTLNLNFGCLKLSNNEKDKIIKLLNLEKSATSMEFPVSEFPLVSQNKTRAIAILNSLISFAQNKDLDDIEVMKLNITDSNEAVNGKRGRPKSSKKTIEFPSEWLQAKAE